MFRTIRVEKRKRKKYCTTLSVNKFYLMQMCSQGSSLAFLVEGVWKICCFFLVKFDIINYRRTFKPVMRRKTSGNQRSKKLPVKMTLARPRTQRRRTEMITLMVTRRQLLNDQRSVDGSLHQMRIRLELGTGHMHISYARAIRQYKNRDVRARHIA